ncbi:DUF6431 domain-containing protein [Zhaonella formicivorans]|uniref:DUF6431 domain-containing protein n=1 Tax=Zhaonella formicivorans TaxID=2528593 RepID=UPI0010E154D0|nr:DUF6431 domain-containing protein [Zhaonella formicivorans]
MIVTYLGTSVKEYLEKHLHILGQKQWFCPLCQTKMAAHGQYLRKLITADETVARIPIARFRCGNCRRTHAILPDFISPYRHYSMDIIAPAVEEVVDDQVPPERVQGGQDIPTTRRWVRRFLKRYSEAVGVLESLAFRLSKRIDSLIKENWPSPWQQLRAALDKLPPIDSTSVLGAVNIWLTMDVVGLWL